MQASDFEEFRDLMRGCWLTITHGRDEPPAVILDTFWRAFSAVPMADFARALDRHMRDPKHGEFLPRPASIERWLANARADDGRPEPDEAWGIAAAAEGEAATVVWTPEIRDAWHVCEPIAVAGRDKVGGRKTFLASYERLVADARAKAEPIRWEISHGHDPHLRVAAIEQAARLNRIASADALAVIAMVRPLALPAAACALAASDGVVAGLLGHVRAVGDEGALAKLAETKRVLVERRAERLAAQDASRDAELAVAAKRAAAMVELHGGADAVARATERVMSLVPPARRKRAKVAA